MAKRARRQLIVADAGPMIALGVANLLPQLVKHYAGLLVPRAVIDECIADPSAPGAKAVQDACKLAGLEVIPVAAIAPLDPAYEQGLGSGEVAVLSYAAQHQHIALIDERRTRSVAQRLQVPVIGSGAVLIDLKRSGRITAVQPVLALWQAHGYFISPRLALELLQLAGEAP